MKFQFKRGQFVLLFKNFIFCFVLLILILLTFKTIWSITVGPVYNLHQGLRRFIRSVDWEIETEPCCSINGTDTSELEDTFFYCQQTREEMIVLRHGPKMRHLLPIRFFFISGFACLYTHHHHWLTAGWFTLFGWLVGMKWPRKSKCS